VQAKLDVGAAADPLEREADRIAEHVTATAAPRGVIAPSRQGAGPGTITQSVQDVVSSPGVPLGGDTRRRLEPQFGRNFAGVRIHADGAAASSAQLMNAFAYTVGQHIVFAAGAYAPSSAAGANLLAHELVHTMQQRGTSGGHAAPGGAHQSVRCRRLPNATDAAELLSPGATDLAAHKKGLVRLLKFAWFELSEAQQTTVRKKAAKFGIAGTTSAQLFAALATATSEQLLKFTAEVRAADPTSELGDPALIDTGPRKDSADAANITLLVEMADMEVFDPIASGERDTDLTQIFGAANVAAAKAKFALARKAAHDLQTANKIVSDRSGYGAEVAVEGQSNLSHISLGPETIDDPTANESIGTLVHESLHAGNRDVGDAGSYILTESFPEVPEGDKLQNAAHFEVIVYRILTPDAPSAYLGQTFIPAGTTVGGVTAPPPTKRKEAAAIASKTYERAWWTAVNLHPLYVRVYRNPVEWNTLDLAEYGVPGAHFSGALPYWSKVEKMTIHSRPGINAVAGKPASNPVTLIDIAQSESVTRYLALGSVKEDEVAALESKASAAQKTQIAKSAADEAKVLVSLIRAENLPEITGSIERDVRVVHRLDQAKTGDFSDMLSPKSPADFKD
jgi:hypothetical protein